jgi:hypothetical protein
MGLSMRAEPVAPQTVAGGFVLIPVRQIMATWRVCRRGPLGMGDFRTWLACREMVARRCTLDDRRSPTYGFAELARLTGVSEKRARSSVHRLVAAGHLVWSDQVIGFPDAGDPDDALADTIGGGKGVLAIPRRILRLLAGGARPALIATVIAILLRCLSRGRGGSSPGDGSRRPGSPGSSASISGGSSRPARTSSPSAGSSPRRPTSGPRTGGGGSSRSTSNGTGLPPPAARDCHPLPPEVVANCHPLILTRNPYGKLKTRNPPPADPLGFRSREREKNRPPGRLDLRHPPRFLANSRWKGSKSPAPGNRPWSRTRQGPRRRR